MRELRHRECAAALLVVGHCSVILSCRKKAISVFRRVRCRYAVCRELCRNPAPLFRRSADAQCFAALPQTSSQLRCRRVRRSPPQVQNQHPAENAARRAQGLALRAPGRFRRRAEAASAGCHARAMQQRHTPWTLRASPRRGSDVQGERNSVCSEASGE